MADELKKSNIRIKGVEDTGAQIKLRDLSNRTYSFFKHKKDGDQTVAFLNYQNFNLGDEVELTFREVPYKGGIIRNVVSMREATGPVIEPPPVPEAAPRPQSPEYWERREEKRQSSILVQVAFKAALTMQAAYVSSGREEDREKLYNDALEFYDWMDFQIGEEVGEIKKADIRLEPEQGAMLAQSSGDEVDF